MMRAIGLAGDSRRGPPAHGPAPDARGQLPELHRPQHRARRRGAAEPVERGERHRAERALERRKMYGAKTILFVDEVHRWNRAQQDALLPHVENGTVTLIGATTENPYFDVISALVSRSRLFQLVPLSESNLEGILDLALKDPERGYGKLAITLEPDARLHLIQVAGGDARNLLNALELAIETTQPDTDGTIRITLEIGEASSEMVRFLALRAPTARDQFALSRRPGSQVGRWAANG